MIFNSEQVDSVDIWGRSVELRIVADLFPGEEIDDNMQETYEKFKEKEIVILEDAHAALEKFFRERNDYDIGKKNFNIYSFFIPKALYIKKNNGNKRLAGLFCKYRFDKENDIVVLIENERVVSVGTQDIIL